MKIFLYKSLLIFLLVLILFKLTIGKLITNYEKKFDELLSKEYVNKIKIEIREEIRAGIEKDNILNAEDAQLINKFLIKFCTKLFCYSDKIINFPKDSKEKIFVINHVLRKEIYNFNNFNKEAINNIIKLLIVGGSQGAKFFDQNLKNSIIDVSKKYKLKIYHQTSSSDFADLKFFYKEHGIENVLFNFEDNIFQHIKESNLAITRAGASTLSELIFLKVPFIAIPYKFAVDNHQFENALNYEKNECCWILKEEEFSQNKLTTLLLNIIENKEDYLRKKKNLENFSYQNNWNDINEKLINCLNEN